MSILHDRRHQAAPIRSACFLAALVWAGTSCTDSEKKKWDEMFKPRGGSIFAPSGHGELWTIECNAYEGPQRRQMAEDAAAALRIVKELRPDAVEVDHGEGASRVYYGEYRLGYRSAGDGESHVELGAEIKRDLEFIRKLSMNGEHIFFQARPREKPGARTGPEEWNLANARGEYTLHVGVTYRTPTLEDYQAAAIEWVKDLRGRGYEAYYFHDADKPQTSICVGTFGSDAMVAEPDGRLAYSDQVKQLQLKDEFRYNLENGHIAYRVGVNPDTGARERIPNWSFLVEIPRPDKPRASRLRRPTTVIPDFE